MNNIFFNSGRKVSMEEIEGLLKKIDVALPLEYKNFIIDINGGELENNFFELRKFDPEATNINCYVIVDHFFQLDEIEEVWNYTKGDLQELSLFPIADVKGGMLICCRQSALQFSELFFYDYNFGALVLTKSLKDFLNSLIPKSEVDYRKYGIDFSFSDESTES